MNDIQKAIAEANEELAKGIPSTKQLASFVGEGECYDYADGIAQKFPHLTKHAGFYLHNGEPRDHAWVQAKDGTVVDTTYSQFNPKTKIGIFKPGQSEHNKYHSYEKHHPASNPDFCLHRELGVKEDCQAPGCTYKSNLEKARRGFSLAGLGMAAAIGLAGGSTVLPQSSEPTPKTSTILKPTVAVKEDAKPLHPTVAAWSEKQLHPELQAISWNETRHRHDIPHAKHSGGDFHTAVGAVGLKPSTAHWEFKRAKLADKFPNVDPANKDSFIHHLKANPQLYNAIATSHWNFLKKRYANGDPLKAAFAWRHGQGTASKASPDQIENDGYVQAFKTKLAEYKAIRKTEICAAISAVTADLAKSEFDAGNITESKYWLEVATEYRDFVAEGETLSKAEKKVKKEKKKAENKESADLPGVIRAFLRGEFLKDKKLSLISSGSTPLPGALNLKPDTLYSSGPHWPLFTTRQYGPIGEDGKPQHKVHLFNSYRYDNPSTANHISGVNDTLGQNPDVIRVGNPEVMHAPFHEVKEHVTEGIKTLKERAAALRGSAKSSDRAKLMELKAQIRQAERHVGILDKVIANKPSGVKDFPKDIEKKIAERFVAQPFNAHIKAKHKDINYNKQKPYEMLETDGWFSRKLQDKKKLSTADFDEAIAYWRQHLAHKPTPKTKNVSTPEFPEAKDIADTGARRINRVAEKFGFKLERPPKVEIPDIDKDGKRLEKPDGSQKMTEVTRAIGVGDNNDTIAVSNVGEGKQRVPFHNSAAHEIAHGITAPAGLNLQELQHYLLLSSKLRQERDSERGRRVFGLTDPSETSARSVEGLIHRRAGLSPSFAGASASGGDIMPSREIKAAQSGEIPEGAADKYIARQKFSQLESGQMKYSPQAGLYLNQGIHGKIARRAAQQPRPDPKFKVGEFVRHSKSRDALTANRGQIIHHKGYDEQAKEHGYVVRSYTNIPGRRIGAYEDRHYLESQMFRPEAKPAMSAFKVGEQVTNPTGEHGEVAELMPHGVYRVKHSSGREGYYHHAKLTSADSSFAMSEPTGDLIKTDTEVETIHGIHGKVVGYLEDGAYSVKLHDGTIGKFLPQRLKKVE